MVPREAKTAAILDMEGPADIEQPLTRRNLINLAHMLPEQAKDFDLHLVETFNEVVYLTLYADPDPMNPFKQLENPT